MRYLELNAEGVVKNIVIWDGVSEYTPEGVAQLLRCDEHPQAGYGWTKIEDGIWISPKPYPSWVLNETTYEWEPPVMYPNDGGLYEWDEAMISWVAYQIDEQE